MNEYDSYFSAAENDPVTVEKAVIQNKEDFFAWFLPPHYGILLTITTILTLACSLLLGLFALWNLIDYKPAVFCIHAFISTGLALWILFSRDTVAGIVNLACHTVFTAVSFWLVGTVFIYPVIPAVGVLALLIVMNRNWIYYRIRPTPIPPVSSRQKIKETVLRWAERGMVLLLAVVLVITSLLPVFDPMLISQREENFTKGEYIGVTYVNEFMNLRYVPTTGWTMMSNIQRLNLASKYYGEGYDPNVCMLLMCVRDTTSAALVEIHAFRQEQTWTADEYIKYIAADYYRYHNQLESLSNERLAPVKLCGRKYEVLLTDFGSYDEYMLVRAVGKLTLVIYIRPDGGDTFEEILESFESIEA